MRDQLRTDLFFTSSRMFCFNETQISQNSWVELEHVLLRDSLHLLFCFTFQSSLPFKSEFIISMPKNKIIQKQSGHLHISLSHGNIIAGRRHMFTLNAHQAIAECEDCLLGECDVLLTGKRGALMRSANTYVTQVLHLCTQLTFDRVQCALERRRRFLHLRLTDLQ